MAKIYHHIVFLTGAGFSAESGLATFRGNGGLWNGCKIEDIASHAALDDNRDNLLDFYNRLRREMAGANPNTAHIALAELQKSYPGEVSIITQNLDTLHEQAQSGNIFHIHGQINQVRCQDCDTVWETWEDIAADTPCLACGRTGVVRPNIVLFNETVFCERQIKQLLRNADLFIAAGTSGEIPPASGFVQEAKLNGAETVALNLTPPQNYRYFDTVILGKISQTLPAFTVKLRALASEKR